AVDLLVILAVVSSLMRSSVAFCTTAPVGSSTVPVISPRSSWAARRPGRHRARSVTTRVSHGPAILNCCLMFMMLCYLQFEDFSHVCTHPQFCEQRNDIPLAMRAGVFTLGARQCIH